MQTNPVTNHTIGGRGGQRQGQAPAAGPGAGAGAPGAQQPAIDLSFLPAEFEFGSVAGPPCQGFKAPGMRVGRKREFADDAALAAAGITPKVPWAKNSLTIDLNERSLRLNAGWAISHDARVGGKGVLLPLPRLVPPSS